MVMINMLQIRDNVDDVKNDFEFGWEDIDIDGF